MGNGYVAARPAIMPLSTHSASLWASQPAQASQTRPSGSNLLLFHIHPIAFFYSIQPCEESTWRGNDAPSGRSNLRRPYGQALQGIHTCFAESRFASRASWTLRSAFPAPGSAAGSSRTGRSDGRLMKSRLAPDSMISGPDSEAGGKRYGTCHGPRDR